VLVGFGTSLAHSHEFYAKECCHEHDCHPVECGEINTVEGGWVWNTWKIFFNKASFRVSPDGRCHVCVHKDDIVPNGLCIYLPPAT
jgi:hypothetical protein